MRTVGDFTYLVTANGSQGLGYSAAFSLPLPTGVDRVRVIFESQQVLTTVNGFSDGFAPMAIHVYRWPAR
jgi:hypothetical protein